MRRGIILLLVLFLIGALSGVNAQELTVSDIEFIDEGYNQEHPLIILTKEGSALNVQLMNYSAHPYTEEFVITPKMSGGSDGEPCSVSIGVSYINHSEAAIITMFNVSFNVHGIEANSFYFSCWWYKGMVSLTEGEPLELWENRNISKDGVTYTLDNKTKTATLSSGRHVEGEYNIPSELDYGGQAFTLTSINYPAFAFNTSLTSVIIPKNVTNIGNAVFYRCSNLTDVYCYAENVPETGINVFNDSPIASATLHVPAGSIDKYKATEPWSGFGNIVAIEGDEPGSPEKVNIDGLLYYLSEYSHTAMVANVNSWEGELVIPEQVTYEEQKYTVNMIEWLAFDFCKTLTKVRIPKTVTDIEHYAGYDDCKNPFRGCTSLEAIEVDEENPSMCSVDGVLFSKDKSRLYCYPAGARTKTYNVPDCVTWIGGDAFAYNDYLCTVKIPNSVIHMSFGVFDSCRNLKSVRLSENIDYIEAYTFDNCESLRVLDIPQSVRGFGESVFRWTHLDALVVRGTFSGNLRYDTFYFVSDSMIIYAQTSEIPKFKRVFSGTVLPLEEYDAPVTFTKDQMATIILPTEPDASKGKYYRLDRCEKGKIIFEEELSPKARTPYIIVPKEDFSIDLNALDLDGLPRDTVSVKGASFIGSYCHEELSCQDGFYIDIIDATPDCQADDSNQRKAIVGALRACLIVSWDDPYNPGGSKGITGKREIVLKDNPNGIESLIPNPSPSEKGAIYDLSGRKVNSQFSILNSQLKRKGLYIVNGKKIMVK